MKSSTLLFNLFTFLVYPAAIGTIVLYFYPFFFGCSFPNPHKPIAECFLDPKANEHDARSSVSKIAPFRLLVLADPQLEGDSSLPHGGAPLFPRLTHLRAYPSSFPSALAGLFSYDIPRNLRAARKRLDLLGNDFYLAHIHRTLSWYLNPTHTTVLGDLIGSQWISDGEFARRGNRYWQRVLKGKEKVPSSITSQSRSEVLGEDAQWSRRIINIAGNHDIGYAGDLDRKRLERFEKMYGAANWAIKFTLPMDTSNLTLDHGLRGPPELRLVVLNDMNMDGPAVDLTMQAETYAFMNNVISTSRPVEDRRTATILLTHIPLHKDEGVCVDAPFFDYVHTGIREQNHLSPTSSRHILEGIYGKSKWREAPFKGMGRNGIVLTGHDHEGCDVYHHLPRSTTAGSSAGIGETDWKARRWHRSQDLVADDDLPGLREITVRSMMGEFGGNAGMLSAWFDLEKEEWVFAYESCPLGVQHIWWAVHVVDVIVVFLGVASGVSYACERRSSKRRRSNAAANGTALKGKKD